MLAKFLFFYIINGRKRINLSENCLMKKILCLICLFSIGFYSCAVRNYLSSKSDLNEDRVFYGQMINKGQNAGWFNVPAHLVRNTEHLAIYIQTKFHKDYKGEQNVSLYALNKLAQEFDYYYTSMTNIYGTHSDIDGNGKIIILLMDINVNKGAGSQVLGYFNPMDMHGYNESEILYMDISNANNKTDNAIGTIIHEFQHLINYSYVMSGARNEMDSWLNEALSESTSILFNKATAESRISEFNKINYYCFYTWDIPTNISNNNKNNTHVNYPSASVFMNWLYQKNNRNESVFRNIAHSSEIEDYKKVLGAAGYGNDWQGLLINWIDGIKKGQVNGAKINNWTSTWTTTAYLYPGALVYGNSKIHVNPSTDLSDNPQAIRAQIYEDNFIITSRSADNTANENNIYLQTTQKPKYIDLVFDKDGKIKK